MKQFKLVDMREQFWDIIAGAQQESLGYMNFLVRLLSAEEEGKSARRTEMFMGKANFDTPCALKDIDYGFNPSLDKGRIEELGKLHFLDAHENIIVIGPPSVGKSMIATGIGRNASKAGRKVLFVNEKELVERLHTKMHARRLPETVGHLHGPALLVAGRKLKNQKY